MLCDLRSKPIKSFESDYFESAPVMTIDHIPVLSLKSFACHDPVVFSGEFAHRNWQILP